MTLDLRPLMTEAARRNLLLAEAVGLLHQFGKLTSEFVDEQSREKHGKAGAYAFWKVADPAAFGLSTPPVGTLGQNTARAINQTFNRTGPDTTSLANILQQEIDVRGERWPLGKVLLLFWPARYENEWAQFKAWVGDDAYLSRLLVDCHGIVSGMEKQGPEGEGANLNPQVSKQPLAQTHIATVFGYERLVDRRALVSERTRLTGAFQSLPGSRAQRQLARSTLLSGLGDTQRPINDVTLWDISASVAALYKAAVAQAIIEGWWEPGTECWRLLRIGVDRLAFAERASRIPDLLGRMRVIDEALEEVREFLEETCPLGNEVYRDETGSIFVVPDLQGDLLNGAVDDSLSLQSRLERIFSAKTAGELLPRVFLGPSAREALSLGAILREPVGPARRDVGRLSAFWSADGGQEKCVVCSFRPQGGGAGSSRERDLARARHVCIVCLERSGGRVGAWLKDAASDGPRTTVWVDEASDDNGRCALLVGRFVLDHWLDGQMIKTLALSKDDTGSRLPKNPSFARIRRVWETTRRFWADARDDLTRTAGRSARWKLTIQMQPPGLERHHVYEIDVGNQPFPVVWDGSGLVTADNLAYAANVRGIGVQDSGWQTRFRGMLSGQHVVYEPGSYGGRRRVVAEVTITGVGDHSEFVPLIPIAAEPGLFMGILPAKVALQAVHQIERRYALEMGKVRDRLALHVGLVFFPRKTPIPAVIDAGRRFLVMPDGGEWWTVRSVTGGRVEFENGVAWDIPTQLGDGSDDQYYPFFLAPASASATSQPGRWIQRFDFGAGGSDYHLLHLSELRAGMQALVWPSRFDFQFLGNAADRFHVAYGGGAKRPGQRPYYLEQLEGHLCALWDLVAGVSRLTTTQIRRIFDAIEARRFAWGGSDGSDEVLVRLASDLWTTAEWPRQPAKPDIERLARASVDGSLADAIDLFMGILKQRPARDEAPERTPTATGKRTAEAAR